MLQSRTNTSESSPRLKHWRLLGTLLLTLAVWGAAEVKAQTVFEFRQGFNGYAGAVDTYISTGFPNTVQGASELVKWDSNDPFGTNQNTHALVRFDNIFGPSAGQIPVGAVITSATLTYYLFDGLSSGDLHAIAVDWDGSTTFNTFGPTPGLQNSDFLPSRIASPSARNLAPPPATDTSDTLDVWENVVVWADNPTANKGWIFRPTNAVTFGVFHSSEYLLDPSKRPTLTITVNDTGVPALVRTPYLQSASPTSMTIDWRTDMKTDSVVHFGGAPGALDQTSTINQSVRDHAVTLTGLAPATTYFYSVGSSQATIAGDDAEHFFTTPPTPGQQTPFTVWAFADSGTASANLLATRDAMLAHIGGAPNLILSGGDLAYFMGADGEYTRDLFVPFASILRQTPFWPATGNHDELNANSAAQTGAYYNAFTLPASAQAGGAPSGTEAYYSFDYANAHFVSINSAGFSMAPGSPMLTWIAQDLAATNADWVIAYLHHAPYSHGSHNADTDPTMTLVRENILPILESFGVDLVLAGHSHSYERSFLIDGAYETPAIAGDHILDAGDGDPAGDGAYVKPAGRVPHAGAVYAVVGHIEREQPVGSHPLNVFHEGINGSALITIAGDTLTFENVRKTGVVSDTFTINKMSAASPADLNGDGVVNGADLATLLTQWGTNGPADLNHDGVVNGADLATLLTNWG